jgi:hypothetical protein
MADTELSEKNIKEYHSLISKGTEYGSMIETAFKARTSLLGIKDARLPQDPFQLKEGESFSIQPLPVQNVQFEELFCLGYNTTERCLEAVLQIKLPFGYGGPCPDSFGSFEVVQFWLDFNNNGTWDWTATSQVHVFDPCAKDPCQCKPLMPINYSVLQKVSLPVSLQTKINCRCIKAKAQLRWNNIGFWGNTITKTIRMHK